MKFYGPNRAYLTRFVRTLYDHLRELET